MNSLRSSAPLLRFQNLWDELMPQQIDMPEDDCFLIWINNHPESDIEDTIRKTARKFSRMVQYDVPIQSPDAPARYVSSVLGHLRAQAQAREPQI